jgi:alpha-L-arabinofuranosidase
MKTKYQFLVTLLLVLRINQGCQEKESGVTIKIFPDSTVNTVAHHPIGINLDYFMDDDNYLKPAIHTANALKSMGVRYLRYPGGNKSDLYLFSVPPFEKSQPTLARTGKGSVGYERVIKDNREYKFDVLDFDEFIKMCRETNCEPIVVVAADEYMGNYPPGTRVTNREGLIQNAVEWVRYANIKKNYKVRYWMIGNECWHDNNENSTAEIYARDVVDFSKAMKSIDPTIFVIPNGHTPEFCETVLGIAGDYIDYLCISNYPVYQYKAGYATYRDTVQDLMGPVNSALKAMDSSNMSEDFKLIIAEYGPFDWGKNWPMINDMGHALCNFEMTGEQLLSPRVEFSCFWNTRWINNDSVENSVYDALDKNGNFNAVGYGMMIWGKYLGEKMVRTTRTTHIRTFASYSPNENMLCLYLMNKGGEDSPVNISIEGFSIKSVEFCGQLKGTGPDDVDPLWVDNISLTPGKLKKLNLPGVSITVLKMRLKK